MTYQELSPLLTSAFAQAEQHLLSDPPQHASTVGAGSFRIAELGLVAHREWMPLRETSHLPGPDEGPSTHPAMNASELTIVPGCAVPGVQDVSDRQLAGCGHYWWMLQQDGEERCRGVIALYHGLNERSWDKYLPWAAELVRRTGKAVLMLPIAFHMQRAPRTWAHPRTMLRVAEQRKARCGGQADTSHANAAISARLEADPARFLWSGLETYDDLLALVARIRTGCHQRIDPAARIDLFGFSIGVFLAQIVLMTDEHGWFSDSRLFCFCGGPTFDRMRPASRYILDRPALEALRDLYVRHLDAACARDGRMARALSAHPAGPWFRAMLSHAPMRDEREHRLAALHPRIAAVALAQDDVMPPAEVSATLRGEQGAIPIPVDILDFPYPYSHVAPFSGNPAHASTVQMAFDSVFNLAAGHLGGSSAN